MSDGAGDPTSDGAVTEYDKLVRDRIPAVIRESGDTPETTTVSGTERRRRLREKLVEEAREVRAETIDGRTDPEELADVLEVVRSLAAARGVSMSTIERLRAEKRERRGGFDDGVVLRRVRDGTSEGRDDDCWEADGDAD